jgi:hypothetical protein
MSVTTPSRPHQELETEHPQAPGSHDPELLIEEARKRQRQRSRRRSLALLVAVILAALAAGISHFARDGSSSAATQPSASTVVTDPTPSVLYRKIETVKAFANLPVERRTVEIWSTLNAPLGYRETLTTTGEPPLEIGAGPGHDKVLGAEQIVYLYQPSNNTIYRTGAYLSHAPPPPLSADRSFRRYVAKHGAVRTLHGRSVYVLTQSRGGDSTVAYIDGRTFQLLMTVHTTKYSKLTTRVLARKVLRATTANLKLTDLALAHPGARTLPAPPHIHAVYGCAVNFGNVSPDGVSVMP